MGVLLGTGLALAGSAGTAMINNHYQRKAQDRAFAKNKKWWQQKFDQQNKYNSPVQQMARMRQAGLNPAMMYGGGQGANQATNPSDQGYQAPEFQMDNLGAQSVEFANIKQETRVKRQEELLKLQETLKKGFDVKISESQSKVSDRIWEANADLVEQNALKLQLGNFITDESKMDAIAKVAYEAEAAFENARLGTIKADTADAQLIAEKAIAQLASDGIINSEGGAIQTIVMYLLRAAKDAGFSLNPVTLYNQFKD